MDGAAADGATDGDADASWKATVAAACAPDAKAALAAFGWFAHPKDTSGSDYATQGVGCVEVEVDVLTGEVAVLRADVAMDQGTPLNPLIDLGQAEGGERLLLT